MGRSNSHKSAKDSFTFKSDSHFFENCRKDQNYQSAWNLRTLRMRLAHFPNSSRLQSTVSASLCMCVCVFVSLCVFGILFTPQTQHKFSYRIASIALRPLCAFVYLSRLYTFVRVSECMLSSVLNKAVAPSWGGRQTITPCKSIGKQ